MNLTQAQNLPPMGFLKSPEITTHTNQAQETTSLTRAFREMMIPCREDLIPSAQLAQEPRIKARLLANENPFGPSPQALKTVQETISQTFRYPGRLVWQLKELIAQTEQVHPEQVMLAAGSTEILIATFLAFYSQGTFVTAQSSYISKSAKVPMEKVALDASHRYDLESMASRINNNTSLVYICNPNNPTGTLLDGDKLRSFCDAFSSKVPIMVDEAYIDFTNNERENSVMDCIRQGQNVIVVRTFSKLHALAGFRIGYCIGQVETINRLRGNHSSNCLALPSLAAAIASYQDQTFINHSRGQIQKSKEYLYQLLGELGYDYIPSYTNFVLFPIKMTRELFLDQMMAEGIKVRHMEYAGRNWCRVSMGTVEHLKLFAEALRKINP